MFSGTLTAVESFFTVTTGPQVDLDLIFKNKVSEEQRVKRLK